MVDVTGGALEPAGRLEVPPLWCVQGYQEQSQVGPSSLHGGLYRWEEMRQVEILTLSLAAELERYRDRMEASSPWHLAALESEKPFLWTPECCLADSPILHFAFYLPVPINCSQLPSLLMVSAAF